LRLPDKNFKRNNATHDDMLFLEPLVANSNSIMKSTDVETSEDHFSHHGVEFRDIRKSVSMSTGYQHQVLYNISGKCNSGNMMAIMGRSGSGKTSLLQVLGGRQASAGEVKIYGEQISQFRRSEISYVWQDDIFYPSPSYTVRDQLMFEAYVKMPASTSQRALVESVDGVMKQMQIEHRAGTSLCLVSGGERRRSSIAKELLSDPRVLLMDEGTSGLDSAAAHDLLLQLKNLAAEKKIPVICVIHQPSSRSFYLFDTVLMLCEGYCVYRGPPQQCMDYLSSVGVSPPEQQCNPADFFLDLLFSQEVDPVTELYPRYKLYHAWVEKEKEISTLKQVECMEEGSCTDEAQICVEAASCIDEYSIIEEYKSSYLRQVYAVLARSTKAGCEVEFGCINVLQTLFMALLAGLCWFQIPLAEDRIGDTAGYVLFVVAYWFFAGMFEGMLEFLPERVVLRRELASGDYPLSAYFLAKTLASTPVRVFLPWVFVTISYFMADAQPRAEVYFALAALVVLSTLVGSSIGTCVGCITEDYHVASSLTTMLSLSMLIVGGFYLTALPRWLSFLGYCSAFRYAYRACVQVMFGSARRISCAGGYWVAACATAPSGFVDGAEAVTFVLGDGVESLPTNIWVMAIFFVFFRVVAYWALLFAEKKIFL